ncbi:MAG: 3-deoxy-D-manno-octulosonic acid transferase [Blastocatellia bacterium]
MYFLYSLFLGLASVALLPYFTWQAFINKKYLSNFRERLGLLPEEFGQDARPAIWLHAVSVGETLAARPLIAALRARFPEYRLIVSTTTATGQAVARSRITEADGFCYFPFDWRFSVRRALNVIRPQAVVLMESELWPNFLHECEQRSVPVIVANGRISDRSFVRAQKFGFLVRRMYAQVSHFAMQSEADAQRAIALGAPVKRVSVSGNIKYDIGEAGRGSALDAIARQLDAAFGLSHSPLIVAGSTSDGEEEIVLAAFEQLRKNQATADARLLIAPRHPERFDEVARLLDATRFRCIRRSTLAGQPELALAGVGHSALSAAGTASRLSDESRRAEVILLDSIGELAALYRFASVVFVGGSLVPKGGHNILEPAFYARPVIVGPHMENFREIASEFTRRDALITLQGANDAELTAALSDKLSELLTDPDEAQRFGDNARQVVSDNRGATERTVETIASLM